MYDIINALDNMMSPSEVVETLNLAFRHYKRSLQQIKQYALDNNICPKCTCELEVHTWIEDRGECHGYPTKEYMSEKVCPNCNTEY